MILRLVILWILSASVLLGAGRVEVGQYDNPRNLTLKIQDPFAQENPDLMQPVIGDYLIKVLPPHVDFVFDEDAYLCEGLYFKQVGKVIYIDIRQPPKQKNAGAFDLAVSLTVPGEAPVSNRLPRHLVYTDSATDVLLIIDNSRSMMKNDPDKLRYAACKNFIHLSSLSDKIDNIGIIKFSGSAKTLLPWTQPSTMDEKSASRLFSRERTGNFTNINDAFELASEMFEESFATEKVAILLTDGKNEPARYRDTHDLLIEQGVRVYTVGLSEQADSKTLANIAAETGGEFFEAVDDKKLLQIYNQIAQELNDFKLIAQGRTDGSEIRFPMTKYDDFVDINLFSYPRDAKVRLVDSDEKEVVFRQIKGMEDENTTILRVPNPKPGWYGLSMTNKEGPVSFGYDLHTNSKLFLKLFPLEKKYIRGEVVHFAASMAHRQTPMLDANMKLLLKNMDGNIIREVVMYDDGVHGDNHAGDGVYCAIYPLDLSEGQYHIEVIAEGKTPEGEAYVRIEKESFSVLEAGGEVKDYFLASVLPLYIDFGKLEQGEVGKANLRLSFEGRVSREIKMFPGDELTPNQGDGKPISWKSFEFPKSITLEPSQPVILSLKIDVPKGTAPVLYNGSVVVQMGDQQLSIPIDLDVKKSTMQRQAVSKVEKRMSLPRSLEPIAEPTEPKKSLAPLAMRGDFDPKKEKLSIPKASKAIEFEDLAPPPPQKVVMPEPKKEEVKVVLPPIQFEITPERVNPFEVEVGQYASCLFKITNLSAHAGNVQVRLDGFGEIDRSLVELKASESYDLTWYWEINELTEKPQPIRLTVFNDAGEVVRKLHWLPKPIEIPLAFYITCAGLAFIFVVYGIRFLQSKERRHGYVSLSALSHLIIVVVAFYYIMPEELVEDPEPEAMVMDLLPDPEPEPEAEPIQEQPKTNAEAVVKAVAEPKEVMPERPKPRDIPIRRQEAETMKREQAKRPSIKTEVQDVELQKVVREVVQSERVFELTEKPVDSKPVVLSVNDRPLRRAVLSTKKAEPKLETVQVQRSESGIYRERRVTKVQAQAVPDAITLKPVERATKPTELTTPTEAFEAGGQPNLVVQQSAMKLEEEIEKIEKLLAQGNVQGARELELNQRKQELEADKKKIELAKGEVGPQDNPDLPQQMGARERGALEGGITHRDVERAQVKAGALELRESIDRVSVQEQVKTNTQAKVLDSAVRKEVNENVARQEAMTKALPQNQAPASEVRLRTAQVAPGGVDVELEAFNPKVATSANLQWAKVKEPSAVKVQDSSAQKISVKAVEPKPEAQPAANTKVEQRVVESKIDRAKTAKVGSGPSQVTRRDSPQSMKLSKLKRPSRNTSNLSKKGRTVTSTRELLSAPKPVNLDGIEQEKRLIAPKPDETEKGPKN